MRISYEAYRMICTAIRRMTFDDNMRITLEETGDIFGHDKMFGVNWSCLGTCTPDETRKMARDLDRMADLAQRLNELQLVEVRNLGECFPSDVITNKERYEELRNKYITAAKTDTLPDLLSEDIKYWNSKGRLF